ncbi:unnamed protein product [Discosporangium mesarthrocarpum]
MSTWSYRRRATHAGSWYTSNGSLLDNQLQGWLDAAAQDAVDESARAVIAPHAGFSYSGPTAAYAYSHMKPEGISRVFVIGPSHHVHIKGCAVSTASSLETPIGDLTIDQQDVTRDLLETGLFEKMSSNVDEDEHSIEMHLPYIAKVVMGAKRFKVVTIMVGSTSPKQEERYGRLLAPYLDEPSNFFVVSSDFCHWGSRFHYQPHDPMHGAIHQYIDWLDHQGMAYIQSQDVKGFYRYLAEHQNTICGRHPIGTLMHAIEACRSTFRTVWVKYAQSSEVVSTQDSSVSYASAVVCDQDDEEEV